MMMMFSFAILRLSMNILHFIDYELLLRNLKYPLPPKLLFETLSMFSDLSFHILKNLANYYKEKNF